MSRPRALITGAGSGLGRALAHRYARAGHDIAVVDLDRARAEAVVAELGAHGGAHFALVADVGDDAAVESLRDSVRAHWDGFDLLINNAGVATAGSVAESSLDDWRWVTNIDLFGVVRGMKAFAPMFQQQRRGHVLSTASFAGLAGAPNIASYGVAKAGVIALSEALRAEMEPFGVRVSVICPSFFKTNLLESFQGTAETPMKHMAAKLMEKSPIDAAEVARYTVEEAERGRFLLLPHKDTRSRWLLKRWLPAVYFKELLKYVAKNSQKAGR